MEEIKNQSELESKKLVACEVCGKEVLNLGSHMKAHKSEVGVPPKGTGEAPAIKNVPESTGELLKKSIIKNTSGKEVIEADYFFNGIVPNDFVKNCGKPVDREDLIGVFNKVFKPEDNILFYKQPDKEVYIIIIPIKYATTIGESNNSINGDFQKHAISFLNEGSVNLDTLKTKLTKISKFVKYTDR